MKMSFRWYGTSDPVTLSHIRQISYVKSIVTAIYDEPVGNAWPMDKILKLKETVEQAGLAFDVIESVPVHEDIKLGLPTRDQYIENYITTIRRLGEAGVRCVCYNFMPVFDWTRSVLDHKNEDGSTSLAYDPRIIAAADPNRDDMTLPGWDASYKREELKALFAMYAEKTEEDLWENLSYFLQKVIPECEKSGIQMAIHPDDPPWSVFGLPRIIRDEASLDRFLSLVDSPANGLTFCIGSLGVNPDNDIVKMTAKYSRMGRLHFLHMRNVKVTGEQAFRESGHLTENGSLDMAAIIRAAKDNGFCGFIRPDHGRNIWGEDGRPGYGLYDRALGAAYLTGLWENA